MTDLTPEHVEAALGKVRELEAAASPAPWNAQDFGGIHAGDEGYGIGYFEGPEEDANAAYAAFARNIALPALEALAVARQYMIARGAKELLSCDLNCPYEICTVNRSLAALATWAEAQRD